MKTKVLVGLGISAFALALAAKEAVVMTVNGVDVPKSEFEYLYHKNSQQQMTPQPIEDYVDLFKLYKLKVADAKAEGLDTLESFRREMAQYRHDLAVPYMTDSTYLYKLLDEAAERSKEEVEARHIMFFKTRDPQKNIELRQRADSLLEVLKAGGDFEALAAQYSGDRGSNTKGGNMGFISPLRLPYAFENAAYNLKEGEISEVIETPPGYHILKGGKRRPASGEVLAEHILIMSNGEGESDVKAKALIDSLYKEIQKNPETFGDIARRFSDDKGSGMEGGKLPWFGRGRMVQEFDSVAFAIADGELSKPFRTRFGYHIIHRLDHKGAPAAQDLKPQFMQVLSSGMDPRTKMIKDEESDRLAKKLKGKRMNEVMDPLRAQVAASGLDSAFYVKAKGTKGDFAKIGKKNYPVAGFVEFLGGRMNPDPKSSLTIFDDLADAYYNEILVENEEENLLASKPEYANLYKEYVDGSLLYEVSLKKVWDKASKDEEGLKKYFADHKDRYVWDQPHAKGYLVQATNDSVADLVKKRAAEIGRDTLVNTIRKEFPREVSITKVVEAKGVSPMIDNVMFGGPKASTTAARYTVYFMLDPKVLMAAEEMSDVRGMVTSDYQAELQEAWEKELLSKYPVKINEKEIKKIKPLKK